jgi:hypothetical protein
MSDFEKRFDQLRVEYGTRTVFDRTYALLDFHLEWAEAVKATDPGLAIRQYLLAEKQQSTIGTFATGSGEGLASMSELYGIMGKRAELLEELAGAASEEAVSVQHLNEALAVWSRISADPNGLGDDTPAGAKIRQLASKLAKHKK